jgi:hypothetical protein
MLGKRDFYLNKKSQTVATRMRRHKKYKKEQDGSISFMLLSKK